MADYNLYYTTSSVVVSLSDMLACVASYQTLPEKFIQTLDATRNCEDLAMAYVVAKKVSGSVGGACSMQ